MADTLKQFEEMMLNSNSLDQFITQVPAEWNMDADSVKETIKKLGFTYFEKYDLFIDHVSKRILDSGKEACEQFLSSDEYSKRAVDRELLSKNIKGKVEGLVFNLPGGKKIPVKWLITLRIEVIKAVRNHLEYVKSIPGSILDEKNNQSQQVVEKQEQAVAEAEQEQSAAHHSELHRQRAEESQEESRRSQETHEIRQQEEVAHRHAHSLVEQSINREYPQKTLEDIQSLALQNSDNCIAIVFIFPNTQTMSELVEANQIAFVRKKASIDSSHPMDLISPVTHFCASAGFIKNGQAFPIIERYYQVQYLLNYYNEHKIPMPERAPIARVATYAYAEIKKPWEVRFKDLRWAPENTHIKIPLKDIEAIKPKIEVNGGILEKKKQYHIGETLKVKLDTNIPAKQHTIGDVARDKNQEFEYRYWLQVLDNNKARSLTSGSMLKFRPLKSKDSEEVVLDIDSRKMKESVSTVKLFVFCKKVDHLGEKQVDQGIISKVEIGTFRLNKNGIKSVDSLNKAKIQSNTNIKLTGASSYGVVSEDSYFGSENIVISGKLYSFTKESLVPKITFYGEQNRRVVFKDAVIKLQGDKYSITIPDIKSIKEKTPKGFSIELFDSYSNRLDLSHIEIVPSDKVKFNDKLILSKAQEYGGETIDFSVALDGALYKRLLGNRYVQHTALAVEYKDMSNKTLQSVSLGSVQQYLDNNQTLRGSLKLPDVPKTQAIQVRLHMLLGNTEIGEFVQSLKVEPRKRLEDLEARTLKELEGEYNKIKNLGQFVVSLKSAASKVDPSKPFPTAGFLKYAKEELEKYKLNRAGALDTVIEQVESIEVELDKFERGYLENIPPSELGLAQEIRQYMLEELGRYESFYSYCHQITQKINTIQKEIDKVLVEVERQSVSPVDGFSRFVRSLLNEEQNLTTLLDGIKKTGESIGRLQNARKRLMQSHINSSKNRLTRQNYNQ